MPSTPTERNRRNEGLASPAAAESVMAPVGRWGKQGSSLRLGEREWGGVAEEPECGASGRGAD